MTTPYPSFSRRLQSVPGTGLATEDLANGATIRAPDAGEAVFGRYVLRTLLGRGGMGIVWLGYDERLEREVALKFLPEEICFDPRALDELKRETRRCLDLTHPNIVRIHDFAKDQLTAAISMEYVDGKTLAALGVEREQRIFMVEEVKPWIVQVCHALHYAHEEVGVVHRDLKPANLMLTSRGQIKIADFGIAQSMGQSMSRLTLRHQTSGTPAYMSPQQLNGEMSRVTDDVYAVGATIYELLTSKPPFYSGDVAFQVRVTKPQTMTERRRELQISGDKIPREWEQTVAACLAKVPEDRPQSMLELAERLGLAGAARRASNEAKEKSAGLDSRTAWKADGVRRFLQGWKMRPTVIWGAAAAVIALLAGLIGFAVLARPGQILVGTDPPNATVHVSGLPDRVSPAIFPGLHPGHYKIALSAPGFDSVEEELTLRAGAMLDLGIIKLQRSTGGLQVTAVPLHTHYGLAGTGRSGAFHQEGSTPDLLSKVPFGTWQLTLTAPGFQPKIQTIEISSHAVKVVRVNLEPIPATPAPVAAPASNLPAVNPGATALAEANRSDLAQLYNKTFEDALDSGHLATASLQLAKLKALGENVAGPSDRLQQKRAAIEQNLSDTLGGLITAGRCATALEKLKNAEGVLETDMLDRLKAKFQEPLNLYRQIISAALKTSVQAPATTAYAQLKALVPRYPDDLDLQLALAGVQMQLPPDHEFLTSQLTAFQQFIQQNPDFIAEPSLLQREGVFADELKQLDTLAAAVTAARKDYSSCRSKIGALESRISVLEARRVGAPKTDPFTQTLNFFGKAVTGHAVVDNEVYFSSAHRKKEALQDVEAEIDSGKATLAQAQAAKDATQRNYDAFAAIIPWGDPVSKPVSAAPAGAAPADLGPLPPP